MEEFELPSQPTELPMSRLIFSILRAKLFGTWQRVFWARTRRNRCTKSLSQSLIWDRKDDDGRQVSGSVKIRVGLGLELKRAGEYGGGRDPVEGLAWDGRNIDGLSCVAAGADGTLYLLGGFFHPHLDRTIHIVAVDTRCNYLREVYPPPAALLPNGVPGMPTLTLADGSVVPQVQSWWDLFIPAMTSIKQMLATATGQLLLATHLPEYDPSRRPLLQIGTNGSIPTNAWSLRLPPGMATPRFSMALAPGAKSLLISGYATTRPSKPLHAVYRLELDGSNRFGVLFGIEGEAGNDVQHLNQPAGVACGKDDTVYIADMGNNRILKLTAQGVLLKQVPLEKPFALATDYKTGTVYALSATIGKMGEAVLGRLTKLTADLQPTLSLETSVRVDYGYGKLPARFAGMAVSGVDGKPTIWIGCTSMPDGCNGYPYGYGYALLKVTDERGELRSEVIDLSGPIFGARRKKRAQASAVQRDGYIYKYSMRSSGDPSVIWLTRFDSSGKEAPFPAAGTNKWVAMLGRPSSRYFGRAVISYQNDILFSYYNWLGNDPTKKYPATTIDLIAPDGTVKKREFVYGLHEGTFSSSLLVDRKGCVYVADHVQPPGRVAPLEIEAAFGGDPRRVGATYVETYGSILKFRPTGGGLTWGAPPVSERVEEDLIREPRMVRDFAWGKDNYATCEGIEWQFLGAAQCPLREDVVCAAVWALLSTGMGDCMCRMLIGCACMFWMQMQTTFCA